MTDTLRKQLFLKRAGAVLAFCWPLCAAAQASAATNYTFVDLGPVGYAGGPNHIANNEITVGSIEGANGQDHAVIYYGQHILDINSPGFGGANSVAFGNNAWGEVVGDANIANVDPAKEDFCGFQSLTIAGATASCRPFLWWNGKMNALPTLDHNHGNNGIAEAINDFGEVVGTSENTTPGCPAQNPSAGLYQYYQYKPVLWRGQAIQELATVGGDPVGIAYGINDLGEVAGMTGTCGAFNPILGYYINPMHAVLWQRDGTPVDLKSLGGNENSALGSIARAVNNFGHVIGYSSLADNATIHAFFWTREKGAMQDLKPLAGSPNSIAIALNDSDVVVGGSISADFSTFTATIWKNGVATNLNNFVPAGSTITLLFGCSITSQGQIIGLAYDTNAKAYHGYELFPTN
jgi:probable HAF family extracellular repeat protein